MMIKLQLGMKSFVSAILILLFAANVLSTELESVDEVTQSLALSQNSFQTKAAIKLAPKKHLGVASCASSVCHGSPIERSEGNILQNEYIIWSGDDAHSGAYNRLLSKRSKSIAAKLGLKAAEQAKICLDCHADNIAVAQRGEKFLIADGVGCEVCHGGAESWIATHVAANHQQNLSNGLTAIDDTQIKVKLCLSCHFGNNNQYADHKILGAGHPRLRFELETYEALQPFHHQQDEDYKLRKNVDGGAKSWAFGQLALANSFLNSVQKEAHFKQRLVPELSLFDCHGCHTSMAANKWQSRTTSRGLGPGKLRFNDSSLVMLRFFADILEPTSQQQILSEIRSLHLASTKSFAAIKGSAAVLQKHLNILLETLKITEFNEKTLTRMRRAIITAGATGAFSDYLSAEQAAMSVDLLSRRINLKEYNQLSDQLDQLFESISNENDFETAAYIKAMLSIQRTLE